MSTEVRIPTLGESVTEGVIVRWIKGEGDTVAVDDPLLELETDKASVEIPAEVAGVLTLLKKEGETVEVGDVVARIEDGAGKQPKKEGKTPAQEDEKRKASEAATPEAAPQEVQAPKPSPQAPKPPSPSLHPVPLLRTAAVVPERVVALAHGLAEADVLRTLDEIEAFLRVAGDAVEQRPERTARGETHVLDGLIAQQLQHDELIGRHLRHALGQRQGMFL
jgi:2-oxoglutarate dehydrogenase E2 component (dihydrolipoamide succinyltransferase)